jgi:hypothetical protein
LISAPLLLFLYSILEDGALVISDGEEVGDMVMTLSVRGHKSRRTAGDDDDDGDDGGRRVCMSQA